MTLYFAYGSNMNRAGMAARCPGARALGVARLPGWRFVIGRDGYASIARAAGGGVIGILWLVGAREIAVLNAYESLDSGLYTRSQVTVRHDGGAKAAMVYIARGRKIGRPRPGYMELIVAAARDWRFPVDYIRALQRWSPSAFRGARAAETGEAG
jgi:gamma-glutamylcyclotransferase (GGCT)/AIG2-like uncharacterized protein YtfP